MSVGQCSRTQVKVEQRLTLMLETTNQNRKHILEFVKDVILSGCMYANVNIDCSEMSM